MTDRPTDRQTERRGYSEVTLPITVRGFGSREPKVRKVTIKSIVGHIIQKSGWDLGGQ